MTLNEYIDKNVPMPNNTEKLLLVFFIGTITYLGGNLHFVLKKIRKITKYEPFFILFGAGMLLGTLFSDLIPHFLSNRDHENDIEETVKIIVAAFSYLLCRSLEYLFDGNHSHFEDNLTELSYLNNQNVEININNHSTKQNHENKENIKYDYLKGLIIMFSYSVHSFFEGFAIVKTSYASDFGMIIHKFLESLTVAISLKNIKLPKLFFHLAIIFYSLLTPLGYVIASFVDSNKIFFAGFPLLSAFQALAFGSYIFITFDEMIPSGLKSKDLKYQKILVLIAGSSVSMIANLLTHSH